MTIRAERARELLYAIHDAWNMQDIERQMSCCTDDVIYWANIGAADGGPVSIAGKAAFKAHLLGLPPTECISVPHNFRFANGQGRASVEFSVRDPRSGLTHTGTFRQLVSYRDDKISHLEEYHDAQALAAFCELVARK